MLFAPSLWGGGLATSDKFLLALCAKIFRNTTACYGRDVLRTVPTRERVGLRLPPKWVCRGPCQLDIFELNSKQNFESKFRDLATGSMLDYEDYITTVVEIVHFGE